MKRTYCITILSLHGSSKDSHVVSVVHMQGIQDEDSYTEGKLHCVEADLASSYLSQPSESR